MKDQILSQTIKILKNIKVKFAKDDFHEKGILTNYFYIEGSMNITEHGVRVRGEKIVYHSVKNKNEQYPSKFAQAFIWNLIDFGKTAMTLSVEHQFILDYFNEKLAEDYKVKLKNEIDQFKLKENSSLPHFHNNGKVTWLSVSKSYESLIEFIQNLRCWVIPSYGYEDIDAIVRQEITN